MDRLKKYGMYKMEFYFVGKNKTMTFLGKHDFLDNYVKRNEARQIQKNSYYMHSLNHKI